MNKFKENTGCALVGLTYPAMMILGLIVHIWTIVIAYEYSGLFGTIVTLLLPILAEIHWFIKVWKISGALLNPYCMAILGYIVLFIIAFIGMRMLED